MQQVEIRSDGTLWLAPQASNSEAVSAQSQSTSDDSAASSAVAAFQSVPQIGGLAIAGLSLKDGGQVQHLLFALHLLVPSLGDLASSWTLVLWVIVQGRGVIYILTVFLVRASKTEPNCTIAQVSWYLRPDRLVVSFMYVASTQSSEKTTFQVLPLL